MAKKPTLTILTSGYYSTETLNTNFNNIQTQFENTVSRDGSAPNTMAGDLDMNSNDILNVGTMDIATLTVDNISINSLIDNSNNDVFSDINSLNLVKGDVLWYDGSNLVRLAVGTEGQVLKVGASDTIEWAEDNDTDTDTVGVTVEEDDVSVQTNVTVINFITGGAGVVTSPSAGQVDVDLDTFVSA